MDEYRLKYLKIGVGQTELKLCDVVKELIRHNETIELLKSDSSISDMEHKQLRYKQDNINIAIKNIKDAVTHLDLAFDLTIIKKLEQ